MNAVELESPCDVGSVEDCKQALSACARTLAINFKRLNSIREADKVIPDFEACTQAVIAYADAHPGFDEAQMERSVHEALDQAFGYTGHVWHIPCPLDRIMDRVSDHYARIALVKEASGTCDIQMPSVAQLNIDFSRTQLLHALTTSTPRSEAFTIKADQITTSSENTTAF